MLINYNGMALEKVAITKGCGLTEVLVLSEQKDLRFERGGVYNAPMSAQNMQSLNEAKVKKRRRAQEFGERY